MKWISVTWNLKCLDRDLFYLAQGAMFEHTPVTRCTAKLQRPRRPEDEPQHQVPLIVTDDIHLKIYYKIMDTGKRPTCQKYLNNLGSYKSKNSDNTLQHQIKIKSYIKSKRALKMAREHNNNQLR